MSLVRPDGFQIFNVIILTNLKLQVVYDIVVFFLKNICIDTILLLSGGIVFPVLHHFINKEQR